MSMTFEQSLQEICKKLLLSSEDRQSFNKDAEAIRNELMRRMQDRSEIFKSAFNGLSLTGSYLDDLKIDLPDEFDVHIKLKMPFLITPVADEHRPGFVRLNVPSDARSHSVVSVRRNSISRSLLQEMVRQAFNAAIEKSSLKLHVHGRTYSLTYPKYAQGSGVAHTIIAREVGGVGSKHKREISFDFVPAFEFLPSEWPLKEQPLNTKNLSWFAVPFGKKLQGAQSSPNHSTFMVCAPHWERKVLHDKKNLKNSLRLMKALRNVNKLGRLTSYMLKGIYLNQLEERPDSFWANPMGVILIEMLEELAKALQSECLPFFLHNGFNQLDLLPKKLISEYQSKLDAILLKLRYYQMQPKVDFINISSLFINN